MVDVERELGPLFDKLKNQEKLNDDEYQKNQQRLQAEYNEFDKLANIVINPVMRDYQIYLQKKAIFSDIKREPKPGQELIGRYSIEFIMNNLNNLSRSGAYPSVKFTMSEGNIVVATEIKGKTNPPEKYNKDQINQELVSDKLAHLIKSCYDA